MKDDSTATAKVGDLVKCEIIEHFYFEDKYTKEQRSPKQTKTTIIYGLIIDIKKQEGVLITANSSTQVPLQTTTSQDYLGLIRWANGDENWHAIKPQHCSEAITAEDIEIHLECRGYNITIDDFGLTNCTRIETIEKFELL